MLFGANVGTTVTGWLVAVMGLQFKIETVALPLIGVGMVLRIADEHGRRGAIGLALAGFGVLFVAIGLLRDSFSGLAAGIVLPQGGGVLTLALQVVVGAIMTVLMQSSSAAMAVTLTAAQGGLIGLEGAATLHLAAKPADAREAITLAQKILNRVDIPIGLARDPGPDSMAHGDRTQWAVIRDHTNRIMYWRSYCDMTLRSLDFKEAPLDPSEPIRRTPIERSEPTVLEMRAADMPIEMIGCS